MKIDDAIKLFEEVAKASARLGTEKLELGAVAHIAYDSYSQIAEWLKELKQLKQRPTIDAVSEWIPCSERLPSEGELVLVSNPYISGVGYYRNRHWYIANNVSWDAWITTNVIAWMPLPKPYGEREGE